MRDEPDLRMRRGSATDRDRARQRVRAATVATSLLSIAGVGVIGVVVAGEQTASVAAKTSTSVPSSLTEVAATPSASTAPSTTATAPMATPSATAATPSATAATTTSAATATTAAAQAALPATSTNDAPVASSGGS